MDNKRCGEKALARFNWAGKGLESYCCEEHGRQLQGLSDYLGRGPVFIQLPPAPAKPCQSVWDD